MNKCSIFIESSFIHVIMCELERKRINYSVTFLSDYPEVMSIKRIEFGNIVIYNAPFMVDGYHYIDFDTANGLAISLECNVLVFKKTVVYYNIDNIERMEDSETVLDYVMRMYDKFKD